MLGSNAKSKLIEGTLSVLYLLVAVVIVGLLLLPSVNASLGNVKQGNCINLMVLSNCSQVNLTQVMNSNNTYIINKLMTNIGGQTFNFTFCNTSQLDHYTFSWNDKCIDCSLGGCGNEFYVTATGKDLTISKAVTYVLIFIVSMLIFIGLLILGIALPSNNRSDEMTGYIIAVSNLKYFKLLCLGLSYIVLIFISYYIYTIAYAYLDLDFMTTIFQYIFYVLASLTLPFFILMVYFTIANAVRDTKLADMLSRGLNVK
jgi:hypothetical protein